MAHYDQRTPSDHCVRLEHGEDLPREILLWIRRPETRGTYRYDEEYLGGDLYAYFFYFSEVNTAIEFKLRFG